MLSLVVVAVYVPSTFAFIDFVKSLASGPTPVQTPSSQGPTSFPMLPPLTWMFKSPPFCVRIRVFSTPELYKLPFSILIFTPLPVDVR